MAKYCTILFLLLCISNAFAQTDSLTIKLQQYKTLYEKGLIDKQEYAALKAKVLQLDNRQPVAPAEVFTPDAAIPQHKETFTVSLAPCFYYDVNRVAKNTGTSRSYSERGTGNVGFHILAGPVIKKRFHTGVGIGIEGWNDIMRIPVYADFGMKILKTKVSPYYHVSLGYTFIRDRGAAPATGRYNALLAGTGFGMSIYAAKNFVVVLCAEYRLLVYQNIVSNYSFGGMRTETSIRNYVHQAGLRLQLNCF